jgi:hypothetical protein
LPAKAYGLHNIKPRKDTDLMRKLEVKIGAGVKFLAKRYYAKKFGEIQTLNKNDVTDSKLAMPLF